MFLTRHSCIENNVCRMEATLWSKGDHESADDGGGGDSVHHNSSFSSSSSSATTRELRPVCSLDVSEHGGGDINCAAWKPSASDDPGKVGKIAMLDHFLSDFEQDSLILK